MWVNLKVKEHKCKNFDQVITHKSGVDTIIGKSIRKERIATVQQIREF